jgi:hypothetical protein
MMLRSGLEYLTAMWAILKSKLVIALVPIALLIKLAPGGERLAMEMLVYSYFADTVLGLICAFQFKTFDWKRLPRVAYKLVVFYVCLKISQQTGEILIFYGFDTFGKILFPLVLLLTTTIEAGSAIGNAHKLYPTKATAVVMDVLNKISENAIEKIKESVPGKKTI